MPDSLADLGRFLPAPVHIAGLRLVHAVRLRWWRIARPVVRGCRVLVFDPHGRLLLIRHSYGSPYWMLPGGGIGAGEDPAQAGAREVWEETACRVERLLPLGRELESAGRNEAHLLAGWTTDTPTPDGREILEAAFFALDSLPAGLSPRLAAGLPDFLTRVRAVRPTE